MADLVKIATARRMRGEGSLLREIAEALKVSDATVSIWTRGVLSRNKQADDPRKRRVLPILERLYKEGGSIGEIAVVTGVPAPTLYDWRRELGLPRNRRSIYVTDELRRRISKALSRDPDGEAKYLAAKLYVENLLSTTDLADIFHVTSVTISSWLGAMNVRIRSRLTQRTREKLRAANLGSKRYNWKGGKNGENQRLRLSMYMRDARAACFDRDDYTCRSCGQRGGRLNAHHVWPFQRFPEWKYEVWNLVTLCRPCHIAFHNAAGGPVRIAIGPFFSKTYEVREPSAAYGRALAA
jgi:transposase